MSDRGCPCRDTGRTADRPRARANRAAVYLERLLQCRDTEGRGTETLRSLVGRCDVVVIVTRVNSHNAVRLARRLIRQHGCAALFVPRFGLNQFERVMDRQPRSGTQIHATH
jgi:4-hydroxy-3-methylbut-2-enyl diphosphate reductase IspH